MTKADIIVGGRVFLKPHASWNLPWRRFAEEGRPATVLLVSASSKWNPVKIAFDVKRKGAKPKVLWCSPADLAPTPSSLRALAETRE